MNNIKQAIRVFPSQALVCITFCPERIFFNAFAPSKEQYKEEV